MVYSVEQLNYFRICDVAFNLVPDGLRKIFKQEWDFRYKTALGEWKDTAKNGADFYNHESIRSRSKNARYLATIQNGNTAEWDCSCLFFAILFSDSIGTTLSAAIRKDVDDLRQVRNDIAHITEAQLTDAVFQNYVGRVLLSFNALSLPVSDVDEVKNQTSFPIEEVNQLKVQVDNLQGELRKAKFDLQVAQDTIQCKEEHVQRLSKEIDSRVSSFCNLTCKPSHEIIKRSNDVTKILKKMQDLEEGNKGAISTIYLSGNPGCGKSQLARQVGVELSGKWSCESESLYFVETLNAETLKTLTDSYIALARELGVTEYNLSSIISSKEENWEEIIQHLERLIVSRIRKFSKWLIIADNVVDLALVQNLLPPTGSEDWGNGQVLITTQDCTAIPSCSPHTYHESLSDGMQPGEAVEVLTQISQITDQEQAEKVAEILDYQPLALAAAAFYVRTVVDNGAPNYRWSTYLEKLRDGLREATEEPLAKSSKAYSKTMTAAIAMAINRAAQFDEALHETLNFLSLCGSESLPIQAVVKFVQERTTIQTDELIKAKILTSSLILCTCEEDGMLKQLRLHNTVRETMTKVIASRLESQERVKCIAAAIKVFQDLFVEECGPTSKEDYTKLHKITAHSQVLIGTVTSNFSRSERSLVNDLITLTSPDEVIAWLCSTAHAWYLLRIDVTSANFVIEIACTLLRNVSRTTDGKRLKARVLTVRGKILYIMQRYHEALKIFEQALAIYKTMYGKEHDKVAETLTHIGDIYVDMGIDKKATHYFKKALIITTKRHGEENEAVARIYLSLLCLCHSTGQQRQAIEYCEKAGNIYQQKNDIASLALCFLHMGNICESKDKRKAIELYQKSLSMLENAYGEDHGAVAVCLYKLGIAYRDISENSKAIECFQKARAMKEKTYGEEHGDVANCYRYLARVYRDSGNYRLAKELYEKELQIRIKLHGEEHGTVADCCNELANVSRAIGEHRQAIELFQKQLNIRLNFLSKNHGTVARCCNRLANVFKGPGKQRQAIKLWEKEMKIREKVDDKEHEIVAECYNNLGRTFTDIGEHDQAIESYKKELKIREKVHGEEHGKVADCYYNLASVYWDIREYTQAKELFEKELNIRVKVHGEEHGKVADCYYNLARVYEDTGDNDRAIEHFNKELFKRHKICGETYNEDHNVADSYCRLANCYSKTGKLTKAMKFYERASNILKRIYGEDNRGVAACYNNLGIAYSKMNQSRQAIEMYKRAIDITERIYSREHGNVAIYCHNLANVYTDIKEYNQALFFFKKELEVRVKVHGEDHDTVADCYNNLARVYWEFGVHSKAKELYEKELKIRAKAHGEERGTVAEQETI